MPNNWKTYKLSDIGTIARGKSKHRPRDAAHLYGGNFPFIQTGDVKGANHRLNCHSQTYSEAGLAQSKLWPKDTMCITIAANIAETTILNYPACFPDSIIGFIANKEKCDIDFVEYLMQHFQKEVQSHSIGSVQDNINLATFERINFLIPPLQEQKSIASILSAIDDKIENNLAINKTLEEMAMALYKHWFVDFGPFQDGEFVESELGRIPKGWEVKRLSECNELILGGTPSRKNQSYWENGTIGWLNSGKVNEFRIIEPSEYITQEALRKSSTKVMQKGTTVLAITGATLGQISRIEKDFCANQSVIGILKSDLFSNEYIYLWIHFAMEELIKLATGGAQQHVNKNNVGDLKIVFPSLTIMNDFQNAINDVFDNISKNMFENQTLTQLRDTLLPKLISGEVRLKEFRN